MTHRPSARGHLFATLAGALLAACTQAPVTTEQRSVTEAWRAAADSRTDDEWLSATTVRVLHRRFATDLDSVLDRPVRRVLDELLAEPSWRAQLAAAEICWRRVLSENPSNVESLALQTAICSWRALIADDLAALDPRRSQLLELHRAGTATWLEHVLHGEERHLTSVGAATDARGMHHPVRWQQVGDSSLADPSFYDRFELADGIVPEGFRTRQVRPGLGTPLVGVRSNDGSTRPVEVGYPPEGRIHAVTTVLRVEPAGIVLDLHDPLRADTVPLGDRGDAPLAADFSAPYARLLSRTRLHEMADEGFFDPDSTERRRGIYLLQPYDPERIPVLLIHGLWSSPHTWFEVTNEIYGDPLLARHVQVWHAMYPSGAPILNNARELRTDLDSTLQRLDPRRADRATRDVVLVGHSMGGVLARLLISSSGERIWDARFQRPLISLDLSDEARATVAATYYFEPRRDVHRAILMAAPMRGSPTADSFIGWLGRTVMDGSSLPLRYLEELYRRNPDAPRPDTVEAPSSIDVLSPSHPVIQQIGELDIAPWTKVHGIVGVVEDVPLDGDLSQTSDGVVRHTSSTLGDRATSELAVRGDHALHRNPTAVAELLRLLRLHVRQAWH